MPLIWRRSTRNYKASHNLKRGYGNENFAEHRGAYRRYLPPEQHVIGKLPMQKIERKHLTWRTRLKRLARQTLCFSRSTIMHDAVIGLFINQCELARTIP
jgi:insertion element IS1 protein InsB